MTDMENMKIAVKRGSELLDEKLPDWYNRIDLENLRMVSVSWCILGQLYGTYMNGYAALGIRVDQGHHYGFELPKLAWNYDQLTDMWKEAIRWHTLQQTIAIQAKQH